MNEDQAERLQEIRAHLTESIPIEDTLESLYADWKIGGGGDHNELEYVVRALSYVIGVMLDEQRES